MTPLLILGGGFLLTLAGCEWLRPAGKLQSGLQRIGAIHVAGCATTAAILVADGQMRLVPVLVFWSGAALAWFGLRSHLESSILLRMIYMLLDRSLAVDDLVSQYHAHGGRAERQAELQRAGWLHVDSSNGDVALTPKGRRIVALVSRLR